MRGHKSRQREILFGAVLAAVVLLAPAARFCFAAATPPPAEGAKAPVFVLRTPAGAELSLESLRGKVILLSFWDCFADACFTTVPAFQAMARKYPPEQFALATICFSVPPALAENRYALLFERCGAGQVILLDPEQKVRDLYRVETAPTTFLMDKDLVIRELVVGVAGLRGPDFLRRVDELVAQPAGTYLMPVPPPEDPDRPDAPIQREEQPRQVQ
jgi:cytochrome c biogenesis protein CcmG/thiol:disulfide interchange protein DsbE